MSWRPRRRTLAALGVWGPGLLVMLADTDAGNVVAAADAGTRFGYRLLPLLLVLAPVLFAMQELAVRLGIFTGRGLGALIRERFAPVWVWSAAAALALATIGSLATEFTGIAGVGEMYGVPRRITLPLAAGCLLAVVLSGAYRRIELVAIAIGLFELTFFGVAWAAHPSLAAIARDAADPALRDPGFWYLAAALIGAGFNPWMAFYQQSAVAEKRLGAADFAAARWDTAFGAALTQCLTAAVLIAAAATLGAKGSGATLASIGEISAALTPVLGPMAGRLLFGAGVVGASLVAAIVCSLALAWGVADIWGGRQRRFGGVYAACVLGGAGAVWLAPDLVRLNVAAQVVNAALLPPVAGLLIVLAATALPPDRRLRGSYLWLVCGVGGLVGLGGLAGAIAGLQ